MKEQKSINNVLNQVNIYFYLLKDLKWKSALMQRLGLLLCD